MRRNVEYQVSKGSLFPELHGLPVVLFRGVTAGSAASSILIWFKSSRQLPGTKSHGGSDVFGKRACVGQVA